MATRKVPVTSVTPASKVKATSKAQQSRTRNLVMGIATATPVGRAAKVAGTAAKAISSTRKSSTLAKKYDNALKAASGTKSPRPYRDVVESVKVLPRTTAPKTDLSNRGTKLTADQAKKRAEELRFDKQERNYEQRFDTAAGGPRAGGSSSGNPGKKNLRKTASLNKAADKKLPIKINSAPKKR